LGNLPAAVIRPLLEWRPACAILAVISLASATACGSSAPPARPRIVACDAVPPSAVSRALGSPVGHPAASVEGAADALAGRSGCAWSTTDGGRAALIQLVRTADMAGQVRRTGFSADARFAAAEDRYADRADEPGIGDRCFYVEAEGTLHLLFRRSYLTIEVAATPPQAAEQIAVALARAAVARLELADRAD